MSLWLHALGADVTGYALQPPTNPNLFNICRLDELVKSVIGDIRDLGLLQQAMMAAAPEIVIHMAAQPLVRESYKNPIETYAINVMGTVHLLEAVRNCESVRSVVNVTTDKCYENKEWVWGYRENEPMGGYDPYSNSKGCSELVTAAYRSSFFNSEHCDQHGVAVATARAGNVIGGGDWADGRLIPDFVRAIEAGRKICIRNPRAIRPWQHVLEPLAGYMKLAEALYESGPNFAESWNFGPDDSEARTVEWIVKRLCFLWNVKDGYEIDSDNHPHEANYLKLDCSKAKDRLKWLPIWNLDESLQKIVFWTRQYQFGQDMRAICLQQITEYTDCEERQDEGRPLPG